MSLEDKEKAEVPKLFLSYSWSSPEHELRVVRLAEELAEVGINVVFDKWDLREGQEANAFMERMVGDPDIHKVAMLCDATYKRKADERKGGVGTESQIISPKVYESQKESKFVAVVLERDADGRALVPNYYSSRIYIDLSNGDRYLQEFERLVRWVFDKPLYQRPTLGEKPAYLRDEEATVSGTSGISRRTIAIIKEGRPNAKPVLDEYFELVVSNLERYRIDLAAAGDQADELIFNSIEEMLPLRDELVNVFDSVVKYSHGSELAQSIHKLFENLVPFLERPEGHVAWTSWSADNFRFFINELFLYAIAVALRNDRLDIAAVLLGRKYYSADAARSGQPQMRTYAVLRGHIESLQGRNQRLGLKRVSLQADLIKKRAEHAAVKFSDVMQADFIAYLRAEFEGEHWWPVTLLYATFQHYGAFEAFARAESRTYFERLSKVLGFDQPLAFAPKLKEIEENRQVPRWQFDSLDIRTLANWDRLVSSP